MINQFFISLPTLLLATLLPFISYGDEIRPIHVEYQYSDSANVSNYRLYKDAAFVCENPNPALMYLDCDVLLSQTPANFTLTAVGIDGVESPNSSPFSLSLPPQDAFGNYLPTIHLQTDVVSGTIPLTVNFDASLSTDLDGTIVDYQWDFADGSVGSGAIVSHIFDTPGVFNVTLSVLDDSGATVTTNKTITVSDVPVASNILPTAVLNATAGANGSVSFDGLSSSDTDGTIQSYVWNFGDGTSGTGTTIIHDYTAAGDYTAILTVIDDNAGSATDQIVISIVDPPVTNTPPVAIITAGTTKKNIHVEWDYTPTDLIPVGFRLYENDRLACDAADPNIRQLDCNTFVEEGVVELFLTAYDQNMMETTISNVFTFDSTGIVPVNNNGAAPFTVQFNGGLSYDTDGSIVSYDWDFGDGGTATTPTVSHTFTGEGIYTVKLIVTDDVGNYQDAVSQTSMNINVTVANIAPANIAPVAQGSIFTVNQNSFIEGVLSAADVDSNNLQYIIVNSGSMGTAVITDPANGKFIYTPDYNKSGTDSFTFKANDGNSDSNIATCSVTISPVAQSNQAPLAVINLTAIPGSTSLIVFDALSSSDSDGSIQTYSWDFGDGSRGKGSRLFHEYNVTGEYTVSLTVIDDTGNTSKGQVTLSVIKAGSSTNTPPTPSFTTNITSGNAPLAVFFNAGLSSDDGSISSYDWDFGDGNYGVGTTTTHTYTVSGTYNAVLKLTDNLGAKAQRATSITVTAPPPPTNTPIENPPVNTKPIANDDTTFTKEDMSISIDVLKNDTDIDGDTISLTAIGAQQNGTAIISGNTVIYTPAANFNGIDSFYYNINDSHGGSAGATVKITVSPENDAPLASSGTLNLQEDTVSYGTLVASDQDNDLLTYEIVTPPAKGGVVITDIHSGTFTYTPSHNKNGMDSFTFKVNDGTLDSAIGMITVTINPVNDNPVAIYDSVTTLVDTPITVDVLANDFDPEQQALTIIAITPPDYGSAMVTDNKQIIYTPNSGFFGSDSFLYTIRDISGGIANGVVSIEVTQAP